MSVPRSRLRMTNRGAAVLICLLFAVYVACSWWAAQP